MKKHLHLLTKILLSFSFILPLFSCVSVPSLKPTLTSITLEDYIPQSYYLNESLRADEITLNYNYSDGGTELKKADPKLITNFDSETSGEKTMYYRYESFLVQIPYLVQTPKIYIKENSFASYYLINSPLDLKIASLVISYEDDSSSEIKIEASMVTGFETLTVGYKELAVTYEGNSYLHSYYVIEKPMILETPLIKLNANQLSWNYIPYALEYIIYANDIILAATTKNSYELNFTEFGTYSIEVLASSKGSSLATPSSFSIPLDYQYNKDTIIGFTFTKDNSLTWSPLAKAVAYKATFNSTEYTLKTNSFSLVSFPENASYELTLQGIYKGDKLSETKTTYSFVIATSPTKLQAADDFVNHTINLSWESTSPLVTSFDLIINDVITKIDIKENSYSLPFNGLTNLSNKIKIGTSSSLPHVFSSSTTNELVYSQGGEEEQPHKLALLNDILTFKGSSLSYHLFLDDNLEPITLNEPFYAFDKDLKVGEHKVRIQALATSLYRLNSKDSLLFIFNKLPAPKNLTLVEESNESVTLKIKESVANTQNEITIFKANAPFKKSTTTEEEYNTKILTNDSYIFEVRHTPLKTNPLSISSSATSLIYENAIVTTIEGDNLSWNFGKYTYPVYEVQINENKPYTMTQASLDLKELPSHTKIKIMPLQMRRKTITIELLDASLTDFNESYRFIKGDLVLPRLLKIRDKSNINFNYYAMDSIDGLPINETTRITDDLKIFLNGSIDSSAFTISNNQIALYKGTYENLYFPKEITKVLAPSLQYNSHLKYVYANNASLDAGTFLGCSSLTSVVLNKDTIEIMEQTFKNCTALKEVKNTEKIITIGSEAFYNCTALSYLPSFANLINLKSYAFYNCSSLDSLIIPSKLTSLEDYVFANSSFKTIVMSSKISSISKTAFDNCPKLESISYSGTKKQFLALVTLNELDITHLTITCSDGIIDKLPK